MSTNFSIILKSRAKHGLLFKWMQDNNYSTKDASAKIGICYSTFMNIMHFKWNPYKKKIAKNGHEYSPYPTKKLVIKLERYFKEPIEHLYPPQVAEAVEKNKEIAKLLQEDVLQEKEIDLEFLPFYQLPQLSYKPDYDEEVYRDEFDVLMAKTLKTLTCTEEKVIKARFWEDKTLAETGKDLNVTQERIRQIEAKALRKLKHPTRLKYLRKFYNNSGESDNNSGESDDHFSEKMLIICQLCGKIKNSPKIFSSREDMISFIKEEWLYRNEDIYVDNGWIFNAGTILCKYCVRKKKIIKRKTPIVNNIEEIDKNDSIAVESNEREDKKIEEGLICPFCNMELIYKTSYYYICDNCNSLILPVENLPICMECNVPFIVTSEKLICPDCKKSRINFRYIEKSSPEYKQKQCTLLLRRYKFSLANFYERIYS